MGNRYFVTGSQFEVILKCLESAANNAQTPRVLKQLHTVVDLARDIIDNQYIGPQQDFELMLRLSCLFKCDCPHYEKINEDSYMASEEIIGKHWCGNEGEFIENCPLHCPRYDDIVG